MIGDVFIRSGPDYGVYKRGCFGALIHCLQCGPNVDVRSLAGPGSYTQNAGVSPHIMADKNRTVQILDETHSGAHAGSQANPLLTAFEVVGYAENTTEQWWDYAPALLNQARAVGNLWKVMGWDPADLKWGSLAELAEARRRYVDGKGPAAPRLWIHWDVSKILGGTTHWDVGKNFLWEDFPRWAREWVIGAGAPGTGGKPDNGGTGTGVAGPDPAKNYVAWLMHWNVPA